MTKPVKFPKILYKYKDYSSELNRRILFDFELFLASTSMFNDPYEGSIPFTYDPADLTPSNIFLKLRQIAIYDNPEWTEAQIQHHCYEAQRKDLMNDENHIEKFNEQNRIEIDKVFGIFCLTKHPLNYLMWSHYGKSHTGFCLGFDSTILYNTVDGIFGPVRYKTELPKLELFGSSLNYYFNQLATKSKVWEYESEFRIVKPDAAKLTIKYPKEMLKEIYLGFKMSFLEKKEIIKFVEENNIGCKIFDLSLNKETFRLNAMNIYL